MFWTTWSLYEDAGQVWRAGMDGSGASSLVTSQLSWPNGMAVDDNGEGLIYIADAKLNKVEVLTMDGSKRKVMEGVVRHPFAMTVFEQSIYWSELHEREVRRCSK